MNKLKTPGRPATARRVIVSDSEDSSDDEPEPEPERNDNDDGAILVLNDPPKARKPISKPDALPTKMLPRFMHPGGGNDILKTPGGGRILISDGTPLHTPVQDRLEDGPGRMPGFFDPGPSRVSKGKGKTKKAQIDSPLADNTTTPAARGGPAKSGTTGTGTPVASTKKGGRITKKAQEEARQNQLQAYAKQLFTELNQAVFDNGLPTTTELNWNKRLQTTAGRAKWSS